VGDSTGAQLHYRLNALLDHASAVGAIGHLYGAAAILRENRTALVIPGAEIHRPDGSPEEVDLLALAGDLILFSRLRVSTRSGSPSLGIRQVNILNPQSEVAVDCTCIAPTSAGAIRNLRPHADREQG
jgi:hypothetical protein